MWNLIPFNNLRLSRVGSNENISTERSVLDSRQELPTRLKKSWLYVVNWSLMFQAFDMKLDLRYIFKKDQFWCFFEENPLKSFWLVSSQNRWKIIAFKMSNWPHFQSMLPLYRNKDSRNFQKSVKHLSGKLFQRIQRKTSWPKSS